MLQDILRYALTIDIEEREAADRLGIEPRFQIVSLQALIAIDAVWSLQAFTLPFTALAIYRAIVQGRRYPVPDLPMSPRTPIPPPRFIYVGGQGWNQGDTWQYTGLRDVMLDGFGGAGCIGYREIRVGGNQRTVMDVNTSDMFSVDAESASLLLEFELDRLVDEWHGPNARRLPLQEGHHLAGTGYRFYVTYGTLSIYKSRIAEVDEILRRSAWRERAGLAGYHYNHQQAQSIAVAEPIPIIPSEEQRMADASNVIAERRRWKRGQLAQRRVNLVDLQRAWAPDVDWRRLARTGALPMVAIPRGRRGRLVLRHLISVYRLVDFLRNTPQVLLRVQAHRAKQSSTCDRRASTTK